MAGKPRVKNEEAAEAIGEIAYKHPGATVAEIYQLCRERNNCPVSYRQVKHAMQQLRALNLPDEPKAGGPDYDTRDQEG